MHANANQLVSKLFFRFRHLLSTQWYFLLQMKLDQEDGHSLKCRFSCSHWILSYPKFFSQFLSHLPQHPKLMQYFFVLIWDFSFPSHKHFKTLKKKKKLVTVWVILFPGFDSFSKGKHTPSPTGTCFWWQYISTQNGGKTKIRLSLW